MYLFVGCLATIGILLYFYFWLLYTCHLALKLFFPLRSDKLFNSDYSRVIYIAECLFVCIIAVIPPVIAATLSKYRTVSFPPTNCVIDETVRIYILIIPTLIAIGISKILMVLVLYKLHTVSFEINMYVNFTIQLCINVLHAWL